MTLETNYLGLQLRSPFVVGASPFCDRVGVAMSMEEAGAGALVMRSLFAEQIDTSPFQASSVESGEEEAIDYAVSPQQYLRQIARLKKVLTIPVIASLNGSGPGAWMDFARRLEGAGADAIELNCYQVVTDSEIAADEVETNILKMVSATTSAVHIPVAVKLSPYHTSVAQLALALELAGAAGIVIFNRFYQPDVNTETVDVEPNLRLSDSSELLLRLRWAAILSPSLRGSLAVTGGVHTAEDVVKALLTGAHAVQLVSVLLQHGAPVIGVLARNLRAWMERHGHVEIGSFRGTLNLRRCGDPGAFERANYVRVMQSWRI